MKKVQIVNTARTVSKFTTRERTMDKMNELNKERASLLARRDLLKKRIEIFMLNYGNIPNSRLREELEILYLELLEVEDALIINEKNKLREL